MNKELLLTAYFICAVISLSLGFGVFLGDRKNPAKISFVFVAFFAAFGTMTVFQYFNHYMYQKGTDIVPFLAHGCFVAMISSYVFMLNRLRGETLSAKNKMRFWGHLFVFIFSLYATAVGIVVIFPDLFKEIMKFFADKKFLMSQYYFVVEYFEFAFMMIYAVLNGKSIMILDKDEIFRKTYYIILYYLDVCFILLTVNTILVTLGMISPVMSYMKIFIYTSMCMSIPIIHVRRGLFYRSPKEYMNSIINTMQSALIICDENLTIVYVNDASALMFFEPKEELINRSITELFPHCPVDTFKSEIISKDEKIVFRENVKEDLPVMLSVIPNYTVFGFFVGSVCLVEDAGFMFEEKEAENRTRESLISEIAELELKIKDKEERLNIQKLKLLNIESEISANEKYDPLTQLYNQASIENEVDSFINQNASGRLAVISFDIDDFKTVNDTFGYDFGNELLIAVGEKLKELEDFDIQAARISADEFVLVYKNFNEISDVENLINKIQNALKNFIINSTEIELSLSLGISLYPEHGIHTENLLENADLAVNNAKKDGKNNYKFYDKGYQENIYKDFSLMQRLLNSIEHNELSLRFLPIYKASDNIEIVSLDATCMWVGENGVMFREDLNDIAKKSGFISDIDDFIIKNVAKIVGETPKNISFTIHISPKTFFREDFIVYLKNSFKKEHHKKINIEISETTLMQDREYSEEVFKKLKSYGFKVFISKFGSQYTAIIHLKNMPFDAIRPDKTLLWKLSDDKNKNIKEKAIINAIYSLSRAFGVEIIADGVRSKTQFDFLKTMGFEYFQGYYMQIPETFETILKDIRIQEEVLK